MGKYPGHIDASEITKPIEDSADFIVVGTGAGGGITGWVLTQMGYSVIFVEAGPYMTAEDFRDDVYTSLINLAKDHGATSMMGRAIVTYMQGRCVGGSPLINSAIVWRTPEEVVDEWAEKFGTGEVINNKSLEYAFEKIEKLLNIHPIEEEILGENNKLFREACEKMGYQHRVIRRNTRGCHGSNRCVQGCPFKAKLSPDITFIPWSLEKGARVYSNCKVTKVLSSRKRATGVEVEFHRREKERTIKIKSKFFAKKGVVLAAGAVDTPYLIKKSKLTGDSKGVGKYFMAHPGVGIGGIFDREINISFGPSQGYESPHFRKSHGFKMETIGLPIELLSARTPGFGPQFIRRIENYNYVAVWDSYVKSEATGEIVPTIFGPIPRYEPTRRDTEILIFAIKKMAEMMFEVGAKLVFPGIFGIPEEITKDQLHLIDQADPDPRNLLLYASHLFGGARIGKDPKISVVNTDFQVHGVKGLYVTDASVLPTNLGVNPQHTIMGVAMLGAERIGEKAKSG